MLLLYVLPTTLCNIPSSPSRRQGRRGSRDAADALSSVDPQVLLRVVLGPGPLGIGTHLLERGDDGPLPPPTVIASVAGQAAAAGLGPGENEGLRTSIKPRFLSSFISRAKINMLQTRTNPAVRR